MSVIARIALSGLVALTLTCTLFPVSAEGRWRTGDGRDMFSPVESCRDGMKFVLARWASTFGDEDHAAHDVPADFGGQEIIQHLVVTSLPAGDVVFDQRDLRLAYNPVDLVGVSTENVPHRDLHGTFTIRWSQPIVPGDEAVVDFDDIPDGTNEYAVTVDNCYLSTATNGMIAFASNRDGNYEIYMMNADGSSQVRRTVNTASDLEPAWSPDGTKLAYKSDIGGDLEIYTMNADGSGQTPLTANTAADGSPTWSPDGTQIAFESNRDGDWEIYTMDATGDTVSNPATRLTSNTVNEFDPEWSPEGSKIAFVSNRPSGGDYDLYTMSPDGSAQFPLGPANTSNEFDPYWSADGAQLVFTTDREGPSDNELYAIRADGTGEYPLTGDPAAGDNSANNPAWDVWSPDGLKIAFAGTGDGDAEIYATPPGIAVTLANPAGAPPGPSVKLTSNTSHDISPDWRPTYPGYPRPKAASPVRVSLVPAYSQCTSPNRVHGPPDLPGGGNPDGSCNPPAQTSSRLTVGTPDANGKAPVSTGSAKFAVIAGDPDTTGDEADVKVDVTVTDVRCRQASPVCAAVLADYTGSVEARTLLRIIDRRNGPPTSPLNAARAEIPGAGDFLYKFAVPCTATPAGDVGATCSVSTTADALAPDTIKESRRAIWQLGVIRLFDGGPDDNIATGPNTLFAKQGIFVP